MSDALQPHELQHTSLPVLHYLTEFAQTHVHWVGDAIQPSYPLTPFFSCPQASLALRSLPMSWFFASGGQSTGASASVLPMNIQDWFPLGLTGLISLQSKGLSRFLSSTTIWKHQTMQLLFIFIVKKRIKRVRSFNLINMDEEESKDYWEKSGVGGMSRCKVLGTRRKQKWSRRC